MRRFCPSVAAFAALTLSICAASSFAGVLDSTPPTLGPTTFSLNGGQVTLTPGSPVAQIDAADPSNPELNYWIVPTSAATFTDSQGATSTLTPTVKMIGGNAVTYFVDAAGTIAINLTQTYNSDAIMGYSVQVDNISNAFQAFNNTKTLVFPTVAGPTQYKGTVGITLTDDDGGGALLAANGGLSLYQAQIDGVAVLDLYNSASLPFGVTDGDSETESANSGFLNGGPSATTLGIRLAFVLSPNDSVGITSNFVVLPQSGSVPEPASLTLLGLGAAALLKRRR